MPFEIFPLLVECSPNDGLELSVYF